MFMAEDTPKTTSSKTASSSSKEELSQIKAAMRYLAGRLGKNVAEEMMKAFPVLRD